RSARSRAGAGVKTRERMRSADCCLSTAGIAQTNDTLIPKCRARETTARIRPCGQSQEKAVDGEGPPSSQDAGASDADDWSWPSVVAEAILMPTSRSRGR